MGTLSGHPMGTARESVGAAGSVAAGRVSLERFRLLGNHERSELWTQQARSPDQGPKPTSGNGGRLRPE
jgi:hypothetical protein